MTNEAVIIELINQGEQVRFDCASGVAITKGQLLKLIDPRKVSGSEGVGIERFAGIAAADKSATDGATSVSVHTKGIFDLYAGAGAAITAGQPVRLSGANIIAGVLSSGATFTELLSGGIFFGKALETTTGAAETIAVMIGANP